MEDFLAQSKAALQSFQNDSDPGVWCVKSTLVDEDYEELEDIAPPTAKVDQEPLVPCSNPEPAEEIEAAPVEEQKVKLEVEGGGMNPKGWRSSTRNS